MARHASLNEFISDEQEANLRKLAAYLLTLPADYPDFEMSDFVQEGSEFAHLACGTAACAVGHGPMAGIDIEGPELWGVYSERVFINDWGCEAWDWCFAGTWSQYDNTVHGAAKRILLMLEHGVPEEFDGYIRANLPDIYTDMVLA